MAVWIPVGGDFIAADVIRWKEPVFHRRGSRSRARPVRLGERLIIAEVLREEGAEWVYLLVRGCEAVSKFTTREVPLLSNEREIKRKRNTIARGKAERLQWSDESVRSKLTSKFLGNR